MQNWIGGLVRGSLVLALAAAGVAGIAGPADAATPSLTLAVQAGSSLTTGGTGTYSGTVSAVPKGTAVYVEYRAKSGKWFTVGVASTSAGGAYSGDFQSPTAGSTAMRADVHAGKHVAAAVSATHTVRLTKFYFLDELPFTSITGAVNGPLPNPGDKPIAHAVLMSGATASGGYSHETWNLAGRCSLMTSGVSWWLPKVDATTNAHVLVDGDLVSVLGIKTGDPGAALTVPTTHASTVTLEAYFSVKTARIAWSYPRVLCSKAPPGA